MAETDRACNGLALLGMGSCPGCQPFRSVGPVPQYSSSPPSFVFMLCLAQISPLGAGWPMTRDLSNVYCTVSRLILLGRASVCEPCACGHLLLSGRLCTCRDHQPAHQRTSLERLSMLLAPSDKRVHQCTCKPLISPCPFASGPPLIHGCLLNTGCSSFWIQAQMPRLWTQTC